MLLLMCHVADKRFALPIQDVVEVVARPTFETIPAAPIWLAGSFVHRGVITPVIDLAELTGIGQSRSLWSSRVIVLQCASDGQSHRVGLLVDRSHAEQVPGDQSDLAMRAAVQITPWGKMLIDDEGTYCLLDLKALLSPPRQALLFPAMS